MRNSITGVFYVVVIAWVLCSLVVGVAWLVDSQPNNLYWVWMRLCNATAITFLLYLLFGGRKN